MHRFLSPLLSLLVAALVGAAEEPPTRLLHVGPATSDTLGLTIQERRIETFPVAPYVAREGDELRPGDKQVLGWTREGGIAAIPKQIDLYRAPAGGGEAGKWGEYAWRHGDWQPMQWTEHAVGSQLDDARLGDPAAYRIRSDDDPRFAAGLHPVAVHRKSKPNDKGDIHQEKPVRHVIYLELPHELRSGATYHLAFEGLDLVATDYRHDPRQVRSEAIHATQIGYRGDDPFKRAYLSLWRGTGGATSFDFETFELIDEAGATVYTGPIVLGFPGDRPERLKTAANRVGTDVHYLDFHDFDVPGTYRVLVPGLGTSHPFTIGDGVWAAAFASSMHGFLSHRSGIELGPPFSDYRRPRNMHPADGFTVFKLKELTTLDGETDAVRRDLQAQIDAGGVESLEAHPEAWGGYMDAGDWDRRSQHLEASYAHLELYELYPEAFDRLRLALPPAEADNAIPDLLDEALWNIDCYARLQEPDGGVRGGIESTAHPRSAQPSWHESLLVATFAPDPVTSLRFAACAARASRLLERHDAARAADLASAALAADAWAHAHHGLLATIAARSGKARLDKLEGAFEEWATASALELYRLTGEPGHHERARAALAALDPRAARDQVANCFSYCLLDAEQADAAIQQRCREHLIALAETALEFQAGNAFSLATIAPALPIMGYTGYYSQPEMGVGPVLPRVWYLTRDERYLRGALAAATYSAGANPMNMTYTVGVGHDWPRAPLHMDSRFTAQEPPRGITVYGQSDPAAGYGFNEWVYKWHLDAAVPAGRSWPAAEAYVDLYKWPAMNEYTIHQSFRPTSCYWGFLAARDAR